MMAGYGCSGFTCLCNYVDLPLHLFRDRCEFLGGGRIGPDHGVQLLIVAMA